ncbi:Rec8 like protein-domain-containing protein [Endogone sp. FLAS-F59071]|nr:Rec8 like protein-domain-containing protein [Endogone sp. FLAS-F59071]|eukprot:RUS18960.1 Rec8 like protein-domain-containing protein [Endogone sp. FLAS-F59071]
MFYSKEILTRRNGGFGVIWLAATLGSKSNLKKLSRKEVIGVDIAKACEYITRPPEHLALRLSSNLMVGVARVYNQQYQFYYVDVNNVWLKLKRELVALQSGDIDMAVTGAKPDAITLMEDDPEFDMEMMEINRGVKDSVVPEIDFGWVIMPVAEPLTLSEGTVPTLTPPHRTSEQQRRKTLLPGADEHFFGGAGSSFGYGPSPAFGSLGSLGSLDGDAGRIAQMEDVLLGVGDEEGPTFFFDEECNIHEAHPGTVPPSGVRLPGVNYDEQNLLAGVMDDHAGAGRGKKHDKGKGKAADHDHLSETLRELLPNDDQEYGQTLPMLAGSAQMEDVDQEAGPAAENGSTPKPKIRRPHRHPLVDKTIELAKEELLRSREEIGEICRIERDEVERKARAREGKRYVENLLLTPALPNNDKRDKRGKRLRTEQQVPVTEPEEEPGIARGGGDLMPDDLGMIAGADEEADYARSLQDQSSITFDDIELARRARDDTSQSTDSSGKARGLIWNRAEFGPEIGAAEGSVVGTGSVAGARTASHDGLSTGFSSLDTPNVRRRSTFLPGSASPLGRFNDGDITMLSGLASAGDEADETHLPFSEEYIRLATMEGDTANFMRYVQSKIIDSSTSSVKFDALVPHKTEATRRLTAATAFYHVLVLATRGIIRPEQAQVYGDIDIRMRATSLAAVGAD